MDYYRLIVEGSRAYALIALDPNGLILIWNRGAESIHGFLPEQVVGKHISMVYKEEDRKAGVPERELSLAAQEGSADDTRWLLRQDGTEFWAEGITTSVRDDAGTLVGFSKIIRDASERRRLEMAIERSNEELSRFAFTVSHDLQEPLRTVKSYAELLDRRYKGRLDKDADEFIKFMSDAATRMTQLLRDILAYSQAGRADRTRPELTQAANVLQWAIMNLDALIKETGTVVTYDPMPMVNVDQTQLSQVFQNLIGNAIKFRGSETPRVHLSVTRDADQFWRIGVTDNGTGIDPQFHERIFGIFKRLVGKEVPGTGIGLSICRKIIEAHGGRMWVESELGKGATFFFTLPAADDGDEAQV